jgi:site-specific DNA-methyltransferase (adenine-specific)
MLNFPLPRIDKDEELKNLLLPFSRFSRGTIWKDPEQKHIIACIDAASQNDIALMMSGEKAVLAIHDPPYNFIAFSELDCSEFINWSSTWIANTYNILDENSGLYIWLGADYSKNYQPFPEFIIMMKQSGFQSRSFITLRNQRGYGTQKNWMSIRQELLYYTKGRHEFNVEAEYTEIPKVLNGYYKEVNGKTTKNFERSKSANIRAGNVWIDIQQVFYRMQENVNGCYAQKPLKALERIISSGSREGEIVVDFFSHSGTTLIACEKLKRECYTADIDPLYCEITLRRLENFRKTGRTGWQNSNPFAEEILKEKKISLYLKKKYNISAEQKVI